MKEIEYVTLDYDGEPVTIEDGEIYYEDTPTFRDDYGERVEYEWNSETCEWVEPNCDVPCEVPDRDRFNYWCEYGHC